jgi:hypothetical protein
VDLDKRLRAGPAFSLEEWDRLVAEDASLFKALEATRG